LYYNFHWLFHLLNKDKGDDEIAPIDAESPALSGLGAKAGRLLNDALPLGFKKNYSAAC
jgi:hypothetical protein